MNAQFIAYVDCSHWTKKCVNFISTVSQEIAIYFEISDTFIQSNVKLLSYYLLFKCVFPKGWGYNHNCKLNLCSSTSLIQHNSNEGRVSWF